MKLTKDEQRMFSSYMETIIPGLNQSMIKKIKVVNNEGKIYFIYKNGQYVKNIFIGREFKILKNQGMANVTLKERLEDFIKKEFDIIYREEKKQ